MTELKKNKSDKLDLSNQSNKKIMTEDLGKTFEMAICLLYNIEFNGKYKYSIKEAQRICDKLYNFKRLYPYKFTHIGGCKKYDFEYITEFTNNSENKCENKCENNSENKCDSNIYKLNVKTTKRDGKVCPQVIGQPSKKKFCEFFNIDITNNLEYIKKYIELHILELLFIYIQNTFEYPIIYYNKHKNILILVNLKKEIDWITQNILFSHIIKNKKWNESTSIYVNKINIGEFQIHNHRDCIKFRWAFEKLLSLFKDNFNIYDLN